MRPWMALALVLASFSFSARAESVVYTEPTWVSLLHTLAGFKALDFANDEALIDEYAMIAHCDWFTLARNDEFKWRKMRKGLLALVESNAANHNATYSYKTALQLGTYDFDEHMFRFADDSGIKGVYALQMYSDHSTDCNKHLPTHFPHTFRAVLRYPVSVAGLPISDEAGEALLHRMIANGNKKRFVYAHFEIKITRIEPLIKHMKEVKGQQISYYTQGKFLADTVQLDAELNSIKFYEDEDMTRLLYTYTPVPPDVHPEDAPIPEQQPAQP